MDIDPRDALLAIDPATKHFSELERLNLGQYRYGSASKWRWNESEVRRMSPEAARRVYDFVKETVP